LETYLCNLHEIKTFKDAMPVSFMSKIFAYYIKTIFKQ